MTESLGRLGTVIPSSQVLQSAGNPERREGLPNGHFFRLSSSPEIQDAGGDLRAVPALSRLGLDRVLVELRRAAAMSLRVNS
jgi:hypothetical protein